MKDMIYRSSFEARVPARCVHARVELSAGRAWGRHVFRI